MALSGTLGSLGLDDLVGFLSTHGVEGVLTICGAAGASLQLLVMPGRLVVAEPRPGRVSAEALDALLSRARRVGRVHSRRLSRAQVDELLERARLERTRGTGASASAPAPAGTQAQARRAEPRTGRVSRADLDAIHARAASARGGAPVAPPAAPSASGRLSRAAVQRLVARADALEVDVERRRHEAVRQVHAVSASGRARFEFTPCAVSDDVVRAIEALGGVTLEPLALLMEVARLADERRREPSRAPTRTIRRPAAPPAGADGSTAPAAALQGDIDGVGLGALLQTLRERRRGGTLVLTAGGREERLYFVDGEAFALRVDADDEFAFTLLGADAADSVRALVRGAAIEEQALTAADQARLREGFLEVLFGRGATFAFYEGDLPPDVHAPRRGITRIALQTGRFLLEAIQRMVEWDDLRGALDDGRAVLRFTSAAVKLEAIRARGLPELLTLVDGRLSFDEAVAAARAPRLEAARAMAALTHDGALERVDGS